MTKALKRKSKSKKTASRRKAAPRPEAGKLARRNDEELQAPFPNSTHSDEVRQKAIAKFHPHFLGFRAYFNLSEAVSAELLNTAGIGAGKFIVDQLQESDPLLGLAHTLALLAYGRAAWLTHRSVTQGDVRSLAVHLQGAERATNTYMQLMNAIDKSRQAKSPGSNISIGQANVAHQQIIQNVQNLNGRGGDERTRIERRGPSDAEVLPAVKHGIEIAPSDSPENKNVEPEHRSALLGGESQGFDERTQTRRAFSRNRRAAKTGKNDG